MRRPTSQVKIVQEKERIFRHLRWLKMSRSDQIVSNYIEWDAIVRVQCKNSLLQRCACILVLWWQKPWHWNTACGQMSNPSPYSLNLRGKNHCNSIELSSSLQEWSLPSVNPISSPSQWSDLNLNKHLWEILREHVALFHHHKHCRCFIPDSLPIKTLNTRVAV